MPSTASSAVQSCGACRRMLSRFETMSQEVRRPPRSSQKLLCNDDMLPRSCFALCSSRSTVHQLLETSSPLCGSSTGAQQAAQHSRAWCKPMHPLHESHPLHKPPAQQILRRLAAPPQCLSRACIPCPAGGAAARGRAVPEARRPHRARRRVGRRAAVPHTRCSDIRVPGRRRQGAGLESAVSCICKFLPLQPAVAAVWEPIRQ